MGKISVIVAALVWLLLAAEARADTVFLKDGRSVWGTEVYEEGDSVIVARPGGEVRFPKAEVTRIERSRSSLPPFYSTPTTPPAGPGGPPAGTAGAPGAPPSPGAPAAPGSPPTAGTPSGAPTPPGPRPPARTPTSD